MERLKTAIGEPHLDSNRGKNVMQQVTGHPKFPYAIVRTQQRRAGASQPGQTLWQ